MSITNRFIDENLPNSITSNEDVVLVLDREHPFSFVRWVEYNKIIYTNISDLLQRYKSYVANWYEKKNLIPVIETVTITDLYKNLLSEVILNYTSLEEKRFLRNIDANNPRDLAIAVPFFAEKIKDICNYYASLRDKLQSTAVEYNLKGSIYGLESLIYNEISRALEEQDLVDLVNTLNLPISTIRNNVIVELEENYDQYPDYLDIGTLPASAYNATQGLRAEYFNTNTNEINPNLFIDFDQAIIDAIKSYPFYLIELGTNNFTINLNVNGTQLDYLKDSDFINNINNQNADNLSLNLESSLTTKYMGTDYYYISTGSTSTSYVSGLLFQADSPFANFLNKNTPTIAAVPSESFLSTSKKLGLFFKPDKIGLLNFNNFSFTYALSSETLSANSLYIFPDPDAYGKVSGGTKQEQYSPLTFIDNSNVLKSDYSNSYKYGEAINDPLLPTFRGYQSREQSLNYSNQGLSRYVDSQTFFDGLKDSNWANSDVFPLIDNTILPLESRSKTLLPFINKTLIQYKSDVYGNEYGLYKIIGPTKDAQASILALQNSKISKSCLILDGYVFNDLNKGTDFNYTTDIPEEGYTYSGVTLKTTNNIPPGSGYFTHGSTLTATSPLSASKYNLGIPSYSLSSTPFALKSYTMQPENFCSAYIQTTFDCNVRDGFTFVAPNSALLTDYPSDDPTFDPVNTQVYYDILADAGINPLGPGYRANFAYQGTFLFSPPNSAAKYYGNYFVVSSFSNQETPCPPVFTTDTGLFLNSYFYNVLAPAFETSANTTTYENVERKTLYETKFETYGDFYFRSSNSSVIAPVSSALSGVFLKYSPEIINEINQKLINFDIYYDYLQLETENYVIFDRIDFDYAFNIIQSSSSNEFFIQRGQYKNFEKISTVWFNELENELILANMSLSPVNSATNFKAIYPNIYTFNLNSNKLVQIYPSNTLSGQELSNFTLSGTNFNTDITSIDKPIMSYSNESGYYSITYLARDVSDLFYPVIISFKYFNGILSNIRNIMYKPNMDILHNNFSNPSEYFDYNTYSVLGSSAGTIIGDEFVFGA